MGVVKCEAFQSMAGSREHSHAIVNLYDEKIMRKCNISILDLEVLKQKDEYKYIWKYVVEKEKKRILIYKRDDEYIVYPALTRLHVLYQIRMKKKIYEIAKTFSNPLFITLTFSYDVEYKKARKLVSNYVQNIKKRYNKGARYIVIPEFQKSGRIHFHMLIEFYKSYKYRYDKKKRKMYFLSTAFYNEVTEIFSWKHGFVSVLPVRSGVDVARYLTKYLSKCISGNNISSILHMGRLLYYKIRCYTTNIRKKLDTVMNNSGKLEFLGIFDLIKFLSVFRYRRMNYAFYGLFSSNFRDIIVKLVLNSDKSYKETHHKTEKGVVVYA